MQTYESSFIGGRWQASPSAARIPVYSASTEDIIGSVAAGSAEDVSRAVAAARRAFESDGRSTPPAERAAWLRKLADGLEKRKEQIASTISQEVGMPISMSLPIQAGTPVVVLRSFADLADHVALRKKYRSFTDPA